MNRKLHLLPLMFFCITAYSQEKDKFYIGIQVMPEAVFHQKDYVLRNAPKETTASYGVGVSTTVQYLFTSRFFAETGVGFISRKIKGEAVFNHPGPTAEMIISKENIYRTLVFPLNAGYTFWQKNNTAVHVTAGINANFLLSSKYASGSGNSYPDTYKKNEWQGSALVLGLGASHQAGSNLYLTGRVSYSISNTVAKDEWLSGQGENAVALSHKFLNVQAGVKFRL
ncbi:MAG: outer membrane beta-barrel protein [Chitinophagaceae bacterium]|nr:outer membrane beta-barrel protein [Chitinophagaceae bacterium]